MCRHALQHRRCTDFDIKSGWHTHESEYTGIVLAGFLATEWGVRTYFVVMSLVASAPGVWILLSRKINAIDEDLVKGSAVAAPPPATSLQGENPSSQNLGI